MDCFGMKWHIIFWKIAPWCMLFMMLHACHQAHPYPDTPVLTFIGLSKDTLQQGVLNSDSVIVRFNFTDGDGDIGDMPGDTMPDLMIKDLRTNSVEFFKLPLIKSTTSGPISVEASVRIYNSCCIFADGRPPCTPVSVSTFQEVTYELSIRDRAGHLSNILTLPTIHLLCN